MTSLRFGRYELDRARAVLVRDGAELEAQPKTIALLAYLIEHRDRVVSKQELLDALWPGLHVTEGVLKRAVHALRAALGDSGSAQAVIRTLPRRGYQFVATIEESAPEPGARRVPDGEVASASAPRRGALVGRAAPLGDLLGAWLRAQRGEGAVVFVAGPAGIGKTRLVDELAERAEADGGRVVWGWCDEGGGSPPFWPWHQVLRRLDPEAAAELATADARALGDEAGDPLRERGERRLFARLESVARRLQDSAQRQPLVIVLEDLHWTDRGTLAALGFLAREVTDEPILIVGTFRDDELPAGHPLVHDLRRLSSRDGDFRIHLEGLELAAVGELLTQLAGEAPSDAALRAVYARTAGNPLFVNEVARLLLARGTLESATRSEEGDEVPLGVRGVYERRLDLLAPAMQRLLEAAAVVGSPVDLGLLALLLEATLDEVADTVDEARGLGIFRTSPSDGSAVEFAHALLRETLLRRILPSRRLALRRALLDELEARHLPDPGSALPRLAEQADAIRREGGDAARALAYDRVAAWRAAAQCAYDDCAAHTERAVEALRTLEARGKVPPEVSIEVRIEQAQSTWLQRRYEETLTIVEDVVARARERGDADALVRAVRVIDTPVVHPELVRRSVRLMELAEAAVEPGSAAAVRIVVARVHQLWYEAGSHERRVRDCARALSWAREIDEPGIVADALGAELVCNWSRYDTETRLSLSEELLAGIGSRPERFTMINVALTGRAERGDFAGVDALVEEMRRRIAAVGASLFFAYFESLYPATRALASGDFGRAEAFMAATSAASERAGPAWLQLALATQHTQLRIDQGRFAELEAGLRSIQVQYPGDQTYPIVLSYVLCEGGRIDEARSLFEAAADRYEAAWDPNANVTLTVMASVCASLGDAQRAEKLYAMLVPSRELVAVNLGFWICQGSVEWPLGLLARAAGWSARAEEHLEAARRRNAELGLRTYVARSSLELAELLAATGRSGDRDRARRALEEALVLGHAIGLPRVISRAQAVKEGLER